MDFLKESIQRIENKIDALFLKHDIVWKEFIEFKATANGEIKTLKEELKRRVNWKSTILASILSGSVVAVVSLITRFVK